MGKGIIKMKYLKSFLIVLVTILTIILLLFVFTKQKLVQLIEKAEEIKEKIFILWKEKLMPFLDGIFKKISTILKKEIEQRKSIIKGELEKEKVKVKTGISQVEKSFVIKAQEYFKKIRDEIIEKTDSLIKKQLQR